MRLAETELHLAVEVMSEQFTINGLLRRFEALERELCAELLDAPSNSISGPSAGVKRPRSSVPAAEASIG